MSIIVNRTNKLHQTDTQEQSSQTLWPMNFHDIIHYRHIVTVKFKDLIIFSVF